MLLLSCRQNDWNANPESPVTYKIFLHPLQYTVSSIRPQCVAPGDDVSYELQAHTSSAQGLKSTPRIQSSISF